MRQMNYLAIRPDFQVEAEAGISSQKAGSGGGREYHIRHDEYSFARGSQEIDDSYGFYGFQINSAGLLS
jgi:hypothetical protein